MVTVQLNQRRQNMNKSTKPKPSGRNIPDSERHSLHVQFRINGDDLARLEHASKPAEAPRDLFRRLLRERVPKIPSKTKGREKST